MKTSLFLLVLCVLPYVRSAPTDPEMVWLKDATTSLDIDRRTLSDLDLPDELTFNLRRGSRALILNLKRNHGIDPNADVYVVGKLNDGRPILTKTRNLENEDLAYYQDKENGAFMTVRCVKRSRGQCERVINGNVQIGDRNYDLRPAMTDVTSRNLLDATDLLGTRYLLRDQTTIQRDISVKDKDAARINERHVEQELIDLLRLSPHALDKRNHFPPTNSTLSSKYVLGLHNRDTNADVKKVYWVEMAILIDSTIWDFFLSLMQTNVNPVEHYEVARKIKEVYSHIINGVSLLYNRTEDNSIRIKIELSKFYMFKTSNEFPHTNSKIQEIKGKTMIDAISYLKDIAYWDETVGSKSGSDYDHAMLFTRHDLYQMFPGFNEITGFCLPGQVCNPGKRTSVVQADDYFTTVSTAAHELGHNLGAVHDGDDKAKSCKAEELFIMTPDNLKFDPAKPYSRHPWMFSLCSLEAFKETLKDKNCVTNKGVSLYEKGWMKYVNKLPGELYTRNEQCELMNGHKSVSCEPESADICRFMQCTDPKTKECLSKYVSAARGTKCGKHMWCKEGRCVSKSSK